VPLGYKLCDELLGRFLGLIDNKTVLVVRSSMRQQPLVNAAYRECQVFVRSKDIPRFLQRVGAEGVTETVPTMVPQVNLRVPDPTLRAGLAAHIRGTVRTVNGKTETGARPAVIATASGLAVSLTFIRLQCS
jgi:hypothetical protein